MNNQEKFLGKLDECLSRGYWAYKQYLNFGKKLLFAIEIKKNNESLLKLILDNIHIFQDQERGDLLQIVCHLDSWQRQWDYLYQRAQLELEDEFIFETEIKFPKKSLARLDDYYFEKFNKRFTN